MGRIRNLVVFLGLILFTATVFDVHVTADVTPSENECRPYIEKAIHELKNVDSIGTEDDNESIEAKLTENDSIEDDALKASNEENDDANESTEASKSDDDQSDDDTVSQENQTEENASQAEVAEDNTVEDLNDDDDQSNQQEPNVAEEDNSGEEHSGEDQNDKSSIEEKADDDNEGEGKSELEEESKEQSDDNDQHEDDGDKESENKSDEVDTDSKENTTGEVNNSEENAEEGEAKDQDGSEENESEQANDATNEDSAEKSLNESVDEEKTNSASVEESENQTEETTDTAEEDSNEEPTASDGDENSKETSAENDTKEDDQANDEDSVEEAVRAKRSLPDEANDAQSDENDNDDSTPDNTDDSEETVKEASTENENDSKETESEAQDSKENEPESGEDAVAESSKEEGEQESDEADVDKAEESMPEEDLTMEFEIPKNLRPRGHVSDLLGLDAESSIKETALKRTGDVVLKELKRVFDNAIKPLESLYKYRDLSNRHFGDPEIFSKPLILFMGPWSGGKSTILNYLTENEYTPNSIRSGAEPSPAYFNILMHGDKPEVLDGTQLAADWTFSGLQKFGQGLMDRLRGQKLPNKLLERVNIVEIPGILEVRKQVSKYFPFNDACQWFIDRADIIFLVYDPSKLDVGPETEAILDQLKGREYQTKILLNKADQVKPEELLRVQGALIWNISPLMSSAQPPVMYTVSLWSHPFENGAPIRLLQAQERAFLTDLREAIDRRIENKIASARRFAVRIRNHAKMVDCYLTTYYNQKGLFSNKKQVADNIIEHPQNFNIYEGLSTLTNISRYDLPDPEVYMDFFRLNPLYEFKKLSETCTYFKGCPINKLDIAIAYDLPELVGKYKKLLEQNLVQTRKEYDENCNQTEPELPVKIIQSR